LGCSPSGLARISTRSWNSWPPSILANEAFPTEGLRDRYLPEYHFRGKSQQHKSHYALMAAAMIRAGVCPDLLDEACWWGIDDM
jgi:hypothetical protein